MYGGKHNEKNKHEITLYKIISKPEPSDAHRNRALFEFLRIYKHTTNQYSGTT